uniref:Uncharacterized protein n=1 Tax=Romanomermis culicivorax TaxID=13658 RepID=A0A915IQ89_ROMCU
MSHCRLFCWCHCQSCMNMEYHIVSVITTWYSHLGDFQSGHSSHLNYKLLQEESTYHVAQLAQL